MKGKISVVSVENSIKVALMQLLPENSLEGNLNKSIEYCRLANKMGADIALFPEMWSCGYNIPQSKSILNDLAITSDSRFLSCFQSLAKELEIAIGITFLEKHKSGFRNTMRLYDMSGKPVFTYAKVHTCDFGDEKVLTAGDDFFVANLNTNSGLVKVGAMICYDREFPESARILMLKGAEIILVPNACPMEINRLSQLRARAYENMVGIATTNYPNGKPDCNGHSSAFDGIAYHPGEAKSRDTLIVEAGESEGIYIADFPIDEIREYRKSEVHGNAYRHPKKYGLLIDETINEPFIRNDYRK